MNKNKKLLQNIDIFYKLAVYSDRSAFLKALAGAVTLSENIRQRINSVIKDLSFLKPNESRNLQVKLMNFVDMGTQDKAFDEASLNELYQAVVDASNTIPGNNTVQVERALELAQMIRQLQTPQTSEPSDSVMKMPAEQIVGYKPIPKSVQSHLSELNTAKGFGLPLALVDGKIGPDTRAAINSFKNRIGKDPKEPLDPMDPRASDQEVFARVEKEWNKLHPLDTSWMPGQVKKQQELADEAATPPGLGAKR